MSRSSTEAEYRAIAHGICELIWLDRLLIELKIDVNDQLHLYSDSQPAIANVHNPIQHHRMKHVRIDRNFIKSEIESGKIKLSYVPSTDQEADILTKPLLRISFESNVSKLGMIDIHSPT